MLVNFEKLLHKAVFIGLLIFSVFIWGAEHSNCNEANRAPVFPTPQEWNSNLHKEVRSYSNGTYGDLLVFIEKSKATGLNDLKTIDLKYESAGNFLYAASLSKIHDQAARNSLFLGLITLKGALSLAATYASITRGVVGDGTPFQLPPYGDESKDRWEIVAGYKYTKEILNNGGSCNTLLRPRKTLDFLIPGYLDRIDREGNSGTNSTSSELNPRASSTAYLYKILRDEYGYSVSDIIDTVRNFKTNNNNHDTSSEDIELRRSFTVRAGIHNKNINDAIILIHKEEGKYRNSRNSGSSNSGFSTALRYQFEQLRATRSLADIKAYIIAIQKNNETDSYSFNGIEKSLSDDIRRELTLQIEIAAVEGYISGSLDELESFLNNPPGTSPHKEATIPK